MSLLQALTSRMAGTKTYVDDVFSTYLYTGNGSTQTITNGIDLAGKGGMVWIKKRGGGVGDHHLYDTVRGATNMISSNTTGGTIVRSTGLTAFNSNGFSIGAYSEINGSGDTQVSWTFRKAPKFFDVVTYTGTGSSQTISHSLNQTVGVLVIKRISGTGNWATFARTGGAAGATQYAYFNTSAGLNLTAAAGATGIGAEAAGFITSTGFKPNDLSGSGGAGNADNINENGATYVAYLFAHDTSADGIIQCGSFTTDGSGNATVNLGWEPQYILWKASSTTGHWYVEDVMRGLGVTNTKSATLIPNISNAEGAGNGSLQINSTGFGVKPGNSVASQTYIYLAIRRPNKPPTSGTQVYNAIARTGTGAAATVTGVGFAPDVVIAGGRSNATGHVWYDRLRGTLKSLKTAGTVAEQTWTDTLTSFDMNGMTVGADADYTINHSPWTYINHFFKRAPGVFDQVCYTGTGAAHTEAHNLGVVPELMIVKNRANGYAGAYDWAVYHKDVVNTKRLVLNTGAAPATGDAWNSTSPSASVFTVGTINSVNFDSTCTYTAYLFASKAGISKVGSYTGNGTSQTINCGFTTGARFILIKRTDFTGDWFVWDSVRGIVAGNDPHFSLNIVAAEVTTDDSIDPDTSGFIVNQDAATNINVNAATYIYLSLA